MTIVVDASAIAAVVFEEPEHADVLRLLSGRSRCVPRLIGFEVLNIYLKKLRRTSIDVVQLRMSLQDFFAASIELLDVDLMQALSLAERFQLSFYDACYLQLAEELDCPLVTLDTKLAIAASALGRQP